MKFSWEQDMVNSSDEFENGYIPMHWQTMQGWREDIRPSF